MSYGYLWATAWRQVGMCGSFLSSVIKHGWICWTFSLAACLMPCCVSSHFSISLHPFTDFGGLSILFMWFPDIAISALPLSLTTLEMQVHKALHRSKECDFWAKACGLWFDKYSKQFRYTLIQKDSLPPKPCFWANVSNSACFTISLINK